MPKYSRPPTMTTFSASATNQKVRPTIPPNSLNTMPTAKRPSMANRPIMKMARNMTFSDTVYGIITIHQTHLFHESDFERRLACSAEKSPEGRAQLHESGPGGPQG